MSCIRKQAMLEPLVDTVDANQIVTHSTLLKVQLGADFPSYWYSVSGFYQQIKSQRLSSFHGFSSSSFLVQLWKDLH
jgi:hypothetical protein